MGFSNNKNAVFYSCALFVLLLLSVGCENRYDSLDLSMYQYRDTKNLVKFVFNAALMLEQGGKKSLDHFRENRELYNTGEYYLYIFDMDGNNIFHAGMKDLENTNLLDITDKNGIRKKPSSWV
jgi:signal transduction histidine kinase